MEQVVDENQQPVGVALQNAPLQPNEQLAQQPVQPDLPQPVQPHQPLQPIDPQSLEPQPAPADPQPSPAPAAVFRPKWKVGQLVDLQDSYGDWYEAMVMEYLGEIAVLHFSYWSSRFDEKLHPTSPRIAPHGTHTLVPGGSYKAGQVIDVYDSHPAKNTWMQGNIVSVEPTHVTVHFKGFTSKFDERLPIDTRRIEPFGYRTKTKTVYKRPVTEYWKVHTRVANNFSSPENPQYIQYLAALDRIGCSLKSCLGDGNCLFRSFSHQVYGSEDHHAIMRAVACDYMELEEAWFLPFIAADAAEFRAYLAEKRRDRVWGDDPEIQALCEVFDRPAEIYVYDASAGARKLRTFHSARGRERPPIRLSYYGGGHYDSIIGPGFDSAVLSTRPGSHESTFLDRVRSRAVRAVGMARSAAEDASFLDALRQSREEFDEQGQMDEMLRQSFPIAAAAGAGGFAIAESSNGPVAMSGRSGGVGPIVSDAAAQAAELERLAREREEAQLKAAITASLDADMDALPAAAAGGGGMPAHAPAGVDDGGRAQQEEAELAAALAASLEAGVVPVEQPDVPVPGAPMMDDVFLSEEDQLRIMMEGGDDPDAALLRLIMERSQADV